MHRIDTGDALAGTHGAPVARFDDGDPVVPRLGTPVDQAWLNMVQEELVAIATDAVVTLVKGTNTQLRDSLRTLFVRATGTATQTITGVKTFTSRLISSLAPGASNACVTIQNTDTSADSQAIDVTSSSVGTSSKFRNTSTGRAGQFQSADGYATVRIVPGTTLPASSAAGDLIFLAGVYNKLYCYDGTTWQACW